MGGRPGSNSRGFNTIIWVGGQASAFTPLSKCAHVYVYGIAASCAWGFQRISSRLVLFEQETASRCSNGKVNPGVTNSRGGGGRGGGTNRAASGTRVPPVQKSDPFCRTSSVVARSREERDIQEGSSSHRRTTLCLVTTSTPNGKNMHAQPPRRVSP